MGSIAPIPLVSFTLKRAGMGFDHIIIGSGINGLVAAAMLSRAGKRVLVLERNNRLGGTLRTEQATAPGFTHDVMAATWVLFMTSPAGAALGPHLARKTGVKGALAQLYTAALLSACIMTLADWLGRNALYPR